MSEEFKLVDHGNYNTLVDEILTKSEPKIACNVIVLLKAILVTLSQMQNDIIQLKVDVKTLEGMVSP